MAGERGSGDVADRILDAAYEEALRFGIAAMSIERVARRVGVARPTVYRYFANKDALVGSIAERETRRLLDRVEAVVRTQTNIQDQVVEGFAAIIHLTREHPLVKKILTSEPASAVRFMDADGPVLRTMLEQVAGRIAEHVPNADAEEIADVIVRVGVTFVMVEDGTISLSTAAEARAFARRFLAPMIVAGTAETP